MRCSIYKFVLNIHVKSKYDELSRDHNHLSELTEPELKGMHCIYVYIMYVYTYVNIVPTTCGVSSLCDNLFKQDCFSSFII